VPIFALRRLADRPLILELPDKYIVKNRYVWTNRRMPIAGSAGR
jgi:hypothetical protein